jgi:hypothetical protein
MVSGRCPGSDNYGSAASRTFAGRVHCAVVISRDALSMARYSMMFSYPLCTLYELSFKGFPTHRFMLAIFQSSQGTTLAASR